MQKERVCPQPGGKAEFMAKNEHLPTTLAVKSN